MSESQQGIVVPNRQSFKPAEVCELLKVQPYVLRTWEQEFKELGVAKGDGPRVYRRRDVELAVRIRQLVFDEGLTLAGARRRLESERPPGQEPESEPGGDTIALSQQAAPDAALADEGLDAGARARLRGVRDDLRALLAELSSPPAPTSPASRAPSDPPPLQGETTGESAGSSTIREFTLEPLDVDPYLDDDDASVASVEADRSKRRRRSGR